MQNFSVDPTGVIPVGFNNGVYVVKSFRLIWRTLYVKVRPTDLDYDIQYPYRVILSDFLRAAQRQG